MTTERKFLVRTGMLNANVYAGIQPNDCVVWQKVPGGWRNHSICDHSCVTQDKDGPTGGNYVCGASFLFANGAKGFAPREAIVKWTKRVAMAQEVARDLFFQEHFDSYCEEFQIPSVWARAIRDELSSTDKKIEVNRFGGSPEMLRDCAQIISDCKNEGWIVNLTTPGRRFMRDQQFVEDISDSPPQMLAMSFDDVGPNEVKRIAAMDLDELKAEWKKISPYHGQRQKAYEGAYAAKLMQERGVPVKILFNVVIHPGNIGHLNDLLGALTESVPGCFANPYPAQSFNNEPLPWTLESLPALRRHIIEFIEGTLAGTPGITRRIDYYIMLESAFRKLKDNPERLLQFMSGIGAWDFTLRPGAYRYAQIGENTIARNVPHDELPFPGGQISCFWNSILGFPNQIDDYTTDELAEILTTGMASQGRELRDSNLMYVQTSNIMPRLALDMVSTELGIPRWLVSEHIAVRKEYCGF